MESIRYDRSNEMAFEYSFQFRMVNNNSAEINWEYTVRKENEKQLKIRILEFSKFIVF